ncbi:lipoprotein [Pseudonocardia humida]|uniref:Lipoprotein LpqN n=1 Tax=Pseudonocardia humida TaxID=2800819 RepID=A0ABT0ZU86_9PSEU|nr:lipoprotein [Pseudonocardia humida]MCO1654283.1 hypothetical protein [Pseudonocardia humida]
MVPTRARRRAGTGGATVAPALALAMAAVLAGCGSTPPPAPALGQVPATTFTGGSAEVDVCTELKLTANLKFQIIFDGQEDPPTPENTAQLRADLADYAEDVRAVAVRTTDPTLRPVLDTALAAAEGAAGVASLDELRRTPFKAAAIEVRQLCGDLLGRVAAAEPEPGPPASTEVGPVCDLPVAFQVPEGWQPVADPDGGFFDDGAVGPFAKRCDITVTEPVSLRGSLSVATAPASAGDPRSALLDYLAAARESRAYDEVRRPTFTDRRAAAGLPAAEAAFQMERDGETILAKVCVVEVADGLVALRYNAYFDDDGAEIEAGYRLALQTLRLP